MLRLGFQKLIDGFRRHPGESQLVSLNDNEIPPSLRSKILAHLKQCRRCQDRLMQIEQDWKKLEQLRSTSINNASLSEEDLVSNIQASIHAWGEANQPASASRRTRSLDEAAAVLGVYLGRRAADAMLQASGTSQPTNKENLASAQSALRILIGRRSATAIEMKLHRIMRRIPESAGGSSGS
jgi:hypothetical protein